MVHIFKLTSRIDNLWISCEVKYYKNSMVIDQHWFRWWLGAIKQQAFTWTNVDKVLFGLDQVDEINSGTTIHIVCPTQQILEEPVHQQTWYWPPKAGIVQSPASEKFIFTFRRIPISWSRRCGQQWKNNWLSSPTAKQTTLMLYSMPSTFSSANLNSLLKISPTWMNCLKYHSLHLLPQGNHYQGG